MPDIEWNLRGEVIDAETFEDVEEVTCSAEGSEYTERVQEYTCHVARDGELLGEMETENFRFEDVDVHAGGGVPGVLYVEMDDASCRFEEFQVTEPAVSVSKTMSELVCKS